MSSPDREAEDTRPSVVDAVSASAVVTKEDEDVEMADDDPVTDLFGGLSRGSLSNKVIYKCFISINQFCPRRTIIWYGEYLPFPLCPVFVLLQMDNFRALELEE